ncbi:MAG: peptide/nickel transport system permease protein, partial [Frankiaceae bacterium]|nr:peptide/nickel transport system permease protein [Frankiaceae bacterium]
IRRIAQGVLVLFMVSITIYLLFFAGNPRDIARRMAGRRATPDVVDRVYHNLGLDQPIYKQYGQWLWHLLHGNLGYDYYNGVPVTQVLSAAAPITFSLAIGAAILWFVMGVSSGVFSSVRPRSFLDRAFTGLALFFFSVPVFVLGLTLIYFLFYQLTVHGIRIFPASDYVPITENPVQWARHLILPWFTLALITAAAYTRLSRSSMLEVLGEDYIRTARAKGLSERRVVLRHALRSALTPVVTQFGIDAAAVIGGAILTETVFGLPGLGFESVHAINNQDLPIIIGVVMISATAVVVANILVDMLYAVLDPRVRLR